MSKWIWDAECQTKVKKSEIEALHVRQNKEGEWNVEGHNNYSMYYLARGLETELEAHEWVDRFTEGK